MHHIHSSQSNSSDIYWGKLLSKLVFIPFVLLLTLLVIVQFAQRHPGTTRTDSVEFYVPSDS